MPRESTERLWVCRACEMIGSQAAAIRHHSGLGHEIEELSEDVSDGIREEWDRQQASRVANLISFRKMYVGASGQKEGDR